SLATPRGRPEQALLFHGRSAGTGVPSAFHVSRTYNHFPSFFIETEKNTCRSRGPSPSCPLLHRPRTASPWLGAEREGYSRLLRLSRFLHKKFLDRCSPRNPS